LASHQFRIHYQPVLELKTRTLVTFEALLRWQHPTQGLISPYRFLDAAEDSGILVSVGRWLIVQVCAQLRAWELDKGSQWPITLTMNVSARQFADARLANDIQEALRETGMDPSRLQLEMTENSASADPKLTMTVMAHLKHLGIGVILDDFGIGSASLRGLRQFPVDALKIDRSLIREMQSDRSASDLVEMIITIAHKMGLRVIAEGIETVRQFERLLELGCDLGQGYYFSQPLEPKAALQFMARQLTAAGR
jgi:EAL domain-containing protein (putative c-di-GMP-specific phosphodiesterase class I)